ncbi:SDR family NAD(P)-dependent oxidoreductase [Pseudonocardia sp. WMMC193]|uniref:SDR family NAD(P)-dependent oxidoreductase n=1 Tax=Pseudonocardia sp. WMMC193 TaxID=2911965 RepID=UPI001F4854D2|nr:SDR family NAD(P)-dependent oxidoreductase [Pseudonocardia sp. WMMC193]MCF7550610.1 SDR family NAD(P)-dependent oxidoreductase [Pseudonocardia sp. WMMC193]
MQLDGIAALVTGAASGLGAATAVHLAKNGAAVYGLDRTVPAESPDGLTLLEGDVTDEASVRDAVARAAEGPAPLRLVVNCAGIAPSARILSKRGTHDLDLFHTVLKVNLLGTFNVMRLAAEKIAETEADEHGQRGVVVNTASVAAFEGQIGQIAYTASKSGVAGMTITAARDLAQYGIRVMTIAPGIVETPMLAGLPEEVQASLAKTVTFPQRLAQASEYARLVSMIAEHDYLNGETIRMDGAIRMTAR